MIVFSRSTGDIVGPVGQYETPIKMVIEHESELLSAQIGICQQLFNVEKSNHYAETIICQDEFGVFSHVNEGDDAVRDTLIESYAKHIEHIQFMKEFAISAEMMEDANYGVPVDAKRRAENFTRAYYKTMNTICELALINGTENGVAFSGSNIDTTAPDGLPLFSNQHISNNFYQSNYYSGDLVCTGTGSDRKYSVETLEQALTKLGILFRNLKDESGEPLGYTADTIIIPANRPMLESMVRRVCGSPGSLGNGYNDINIHCGNWNLVVLPHWQTENDTLMLMSSEANKNLCGNMFFNRVPLTVTNWVDHHSGNYIWNGRCRFGIGFGSYKHILRVVDLDGEDKSGNTTHF